MTYPAALKAPVSNRGSAPDSFLAELIAWGKSAPADIFAPTPTVGWSDIYGKVKDDLGPYAGNRVAVMLEVMRVLAGFESSWDWSEGVDTSRLGDDTPENAEAGAWQVSYDARSSGPNLGALLVEYGVPLHGGGVLFQRAMKKNHPLAMEFVARLMRVTTLHNGPLYRGAERDQIRKSLRGPEHSIYPWLSRAAVSAFQGLLAASPASEPESQEPPPAPSAAGRFLRGI